MGVDLCRMPPKSRKRKGKKKGKAVDDAATPSMVRKNYQAHSKQIGLPPIEQVTKRLIPVDPAGKKKKKASVGRGGGKGDKETPLQHVVIDHPIGPAGCRSLVRHCRNSRTTTNQLPT